jgi:hypothetical protein
MMPPAKTPSEFILKLQTWLIGIMGTCLFALITVIWNGIDTRLANIESALMAEQRAVVKLETQVAIHDRLLAKRD